MSGDKFIFVTRCLRIRDMEKAGDIVNMFGQKTELRSTRFGVKFREISRKSNDQLKKNRFPQNSRLLNKSLLYKG